MAAKKQDLPAAQLKKFTCEQLKKKIAHLKSERGTWESHWQEVGDFFRPLMNTVITDRTQGAKRTFQLLDNTGMNANELLAGALQGLLTNPDGLWFEMTTGDLELDQNDNVRGWMQKNVRAMHNVLNNSNFQTEVHELYLDLPSFGTACMFQEEDDEYVVRFSTKFIRDYFIVENNLGRVDQIYRQWKWTAAQIVAEFGLDNVGEKIQKAFAEGKEDKFDVIHAIYPKSLVGEMNPGTMKMISQYCLPEHDLEVSIGQFRQLPCVTPRWSKASGETYGRGPAMVSLPEMKVLNKMNETMLIGAQKVVDPPVQIPDDGFILPIVTRPGGINYYRAGSQDMIKPIFNDTRLDFGDAAIVSRQKKVKDSYYVDQLKLQPQQGSGAMTATEVMQRTEESMRLLGPMLGRMQAEFLRPMIERLYQIMQDKGLILPAPVELKGKKLDVRYSSLIAKSQRLSEGQNIMKFFQAVQPFIALDQTVADNFNGDNAARVVGNIYNLPQEILRNAKEIKDIRDNRAKAQAQQQQMIQEQHNSQQMAAGVDAMKKAGDMSGQGQ